MTEKIIEAVQNIPKPFIVILAVIFIALQSAADYVTADLSLLIFDLIPIFVVTWFVSRERGFFISLISALSWLAVDIITTPVHLYRFAHTWNFGIKIAFFLVIAYLFSELKKTLLREKEMARVDYLTGALNSRSFHELSARELDISRRHNRPLTLAYLDMDNFKDFNDRLGHNSGDALLKMVAENIKKNLRTSDILCRMGGDEFAILFPETAKEAADAVINRLRYMLVELTRKNSWQVTFSMGVATYLKASVSVDEMVRKADALMYAAKSAGKNTVRHQVLDQ